MYQREADEQDDSEGLVVGEALHDLPGKGVVSSSAPSTPRSDTFRINTPAPLYDMDELREMAEVFANRIPPEKFTPAEIQGYLLSKMTSPVAALDDVEAWVAMTLKSKESGESAFEGAEFATDDDDDAAAGPSTSHARPSDLFSDEVIPSYDDGYASMSNASSSGDHTPRQQEAQPATEHAHDDAKQPSSSSVPSSSSATTAVSAKPADGGSSPRPHADGAFYTPKGAEGSLEALQYRKGIDAYFKSSKGKSVDRGVP